MCGKNYEYKLAINELFIEKIKSKNMKYLKLFPQHSDYQTFMSGGG